MLLLVYWSKGAWAMLGTTQLCSKVELQPKLNVTRRSGVRDRAEG